MHVCVYLCVYVIFTKKKLHINLIFLFFSGKSWSRSPRFRISVISIFKIRSQCTMHIGHDGQLCRGLPHVVLLSTNLWLLQPTFKHKWAVIKKAGVAHIQLDCADSVNSCVPPNRTSYALRSFQPIFLIANRIEWGSTLQSIKPILRRSLPIRPIWSQCTSGSSVQRRLYAASNGSSIFS